jgi:hypothetical protein
MRPSTGAAGINSMAGRAVLLFAKLSQFQALPPLPLFQALATVRASNEDLSACTACAASDLNQCTL